MSYIRIPDDLVTPYLYLTLKTLNANAMNLKQSLMVCGAFLALTNGVVSAQTTATKTAKVYSGQLRREVNAGREALGKKPIEEDDDDTDRKSVV